MDRHSWALLVCALLPAGPAHGQAQAGDLGVFFTATPTSGVDAVETGVTAGEVMRDIFVVSFDVPGGMEAYEFGLALPAGLVISGGRHLPDGATDYGVGDDSWIVGAGGACHGAVGPFVLVRYASPVFLSHPGSDRTICLTTAGPCQWCDPSYLVCDAPGDLRLFRAAYAGCAVINPVNVPTPIPAAARSFGALKAAY